MVRGAARGQGQERGRVPACLPGCSWPTTLTSPSIGHNEVIGVCRVGPDAADPHGREHWAEMLANPRKPVEHWHQLVEVSAAPPTQRVTCLRISGSHSLRSKTCSTSSCCVT